jgi:hypothetical protein
MIKKPNGLVLLAHINATSVFVKETENLTAQKVLHAFENGGGDIRNSEFEIIHTNDPQEYENGFKNRLQKITQNLLQQISMSLSTKLMPPKLNFQNIAPHHQMRTISTL